MKNEENQLWKVWRSKPLSCFMQFGAITAEGKKKTEIGETNYILFLFVSTFSCHRLHFGVSGGQHKSPIRAANNLFIVHCACSQFLRFLFILLCAESLCAYNAFGVIYNNISNSIHPSRAMPFDLVFGIFLFHAPHGKFIVFEIGVELFSIKLSNRKIS